ncbi:MAG: (d)CMP kinase [Alphaproteobacteria bacterium]|nr:(d)CMP kinase [Alphaproteobacteria bacterium]
MDFPVIAIDGFAATGKGTIARFLASRLDFAYLDTGALYRAVGVGLIKEGQDLENKEAAVALARRLGGGLLATLMADPLLRAEIGGQAASKVGVMPELREALLDFQRDFAKNPPDGHRGSVLDGRDIGTVIVPDAKVKIFVMASPEVRAHRRFLELQAAGEHASEAAVLEALLARDARDSARAVAPTRPAEDAFLLDTTALTVDQACVAALSVVREKLGT